jgi:hypothetical protein
MQAAFLLGRLMPFYSDKQENFFLSTYHTNSLIKLGQSKNIFLIPKENIRHLYIINWFNILLSVIVISYYIINILNYFNMNKIKINDYNINILLLIGSLPFLIMILSVILYTSAPKYYNKIKSDLYIKFRNLSIVFEICFTLSMFSFLVCLIDIYFLSLANNSLIFDKDDHVAIFIICVLFISLFIYRLRKLIMVCKIRWLDYTQ